MTSVMTNTAVRTITPVATSPEVGMHTVNAEVARALLEGNTGNRILKKQQVEIIARAMREGRFQFNGDAIRISRSGRLLDGQHRLTAIIEADVSLDMLIITNLPDEVVSTIDQGRGRTVYDILTIRGAKPAQGHTTDATGSILTILNPETSHVYKDRALLADYIEEHMQEIEPWVVFARVVSSDSPSTIAQYNQRSARSIAASPLAALCIHMSREGANTEAIVEFFDGIAKGFNMSPAHLQKLTPERVTTLQTLHKRLVNGAKLTRSSGGTGSYALLTEYAHYINAFNRYVENLPVKVVKARKDYNPRWFADLPAVSTSALQ